jgi:nicotinamidase-related amidase
MPISTVVVYGSRRFEVSLRRKIAGMLGVERCDEGTPGSRSDRRIEAPGRRYRHQKIRYSGFYETGLEQRLRRVGVQNLLITGGSTNWGVEALARDAEYRDFVPIVLSDCTIGTSPELHAATLANVDLFIGSVKSSGEAIRMLTSAQT